VWQPRQAEVSDTDIRLARSDRSRGDLEGSRIHPFAQQVDLFLELGLQVGQFLTVALTAFWCSGTGLDRIFGGDEAVQDPGESPVETDWKRRARKPAAAGLLILTAVGLALGLAWWVRERDPAHVQVHTALGNAFFRRRQWAESEEQYRAAVRGGSNAGPVFYYLAGMVSARGDHDETAKILERGLHVVTEREWQEKLQSALGQAKQGQPVR